MTTHFIPKSTVFTLNVPTNFNRLASSTCYFSKAASLCSVSEWTFSVTTAEDIPKNTELTISANGLFTIPNLTSTDAFGLTAVYNSVTLDNNTNSP